MLGGLLVYSELMLLGWAQILSKVLTWKLLSQLHCLDEICHPASPLDINQDELAVLLAQFFGSQIFSLPANSCISLPAAVRRSPLCMQCNLRCLRFMLDFGDMVSAYCTL